MGVCARAGHCLSILSPSHHSCVLFTHFANSRKTLIRELEQSGPAARTTSTAAADSDGKEKQKEKEHVPSHRDEVAK